MPVTYLDIGLATVMLISGLLAAVRGFVREVLSIASWGFAAFAAYFAYPRLLPLAKQYINNDIGATAVVVAGVFILTLFIVSMITIRISDAVLDSKIGVIDRTLGFAFGLVRGLVIVVVAFLFFIWLVPQNSRPDWVRNAKSLPLLDQSGKWLMSMLPENPEDAILNRLKKAKPEGGDVPADAPQGAPAAPTAPQRRSDIQVPGFVASQQGEVQL